MKLIIRQKADDDLDGIFAWIEQDNPRAAVEVIRRIREKIGLLLTGGVAHMGRPGRDEGTRELIEAPYIIVYEVHETRGEIEILAIVHGARDLNGDEKAE
jgi:plasmid stabilization system protein ParE